MYLKLFWTHYFVNMKLVFFGIEISENSKGSDVRNQIVQAFVIIISLKFKPKIKYIFLNQNSFSYYYSYFPIQPFIKICPNFVGSDKIQPKSNQQNSHHMTFVTIIGPRVELTWVPTRGWLSTVPYFEKKWQVTLDLKLNLTKHWGI